MPTIRQLRRAKDWSQSELARRAGVSLSTIQRLEKRCGNTAAMPLVRKAIADALGVNLEDVVSNSSCTNIEK